LFKSKTLDGLDVRKYIGTSAANDDTCRVQVGKHLKDTRNLGRTKK